VEALTTQIEEVIVTVMKEIEDLGGAVRAIETGYMQRQIAEEAYRKVKEEESGRRIIIGVNKFQAEREEEGAMALHKPNPQVISKQLKRLAGVKAERDNGKVQGALDKISQAAGGEENLMPHIIEAVKAYATVGEITRALKEVFGEYREPITI
jgi:methylmalonyl-CoA mutase N-terminal domain/subunit